MKSFFLALVAFSLANTCFATQTNKSSETPPEWMKYTLPGENHKVLAELAGNWTYTMRWKMNAADKAIESKGTSKNTLLFGGRYLKQETQGKSMGHEFKGMNITGYDNYGEHFFSNWIDNMGTGVVSSTGTYDAATKTLTEKGTFSDPMVGEKEKTFKGEWKIVSKNEYHYGIDVTGKDGKEFRSLNIVYKRK